VGEKAGAVSCPGVLVSRAMRRVPGSIEKRSTPPSSVVCDSKTIVEPSGDHAGFVPAASAVRPEPSVPIV
jgi:hypothetical protein